MKMNRSFIICIIVFIVLVFVSELHAPNHFIWKPTFRHTDKQPFGCYVTDSLLSASLPKGYTVTDKTFYQLSQENSAKRKAYVAIAESFYPSETEMNSITRMLKRGDNVMLVCGTTEYELFDSILGAHTYSYGYYRMKRYLRNYGDVNVIWRNGIKPFKKTKYKYPDALVNGHVEMVDLDSYKVISDTRDGNDYTIYCVAVYRTFGKGRLILCANPLLFTNYAMVETNNQDFVFRMFSLLGNRPVIRTESMLENGETVATDSPLTYFLNHPPLRWAIYLTVLGIMLYFIFTARRRQRVIPIIKAPENKSLEFVQLIGTLYHQQHDNTSLVKKKYMYFADRLRREIMADIGNPEEEKRNAALIAENTGMNEKDVEDKLKELRTATELEDNMSDRRMMRCIDIMNEIIRKI